MDKDEGKAIMVAVREKSGSKKSADKVTCPDCGCEFDPDAKAEDSDSDDDDDDDYGDDDE